MGIDVNLYAEGDVTDEELATADSAFRERFGDMEYGDGQLRRCQYHDNRIEVFTFERYYGPGYERGSWPAIYAMIRSLEAAFPDLPIYYGGDESEHGELVGDEFITRMWDYWLSPEWNAYRAKKRGVFS